MTGDCRCGHPYIDHTHQGAEVECFRCWCRRYRMRWGLTRLLRKWIREGNQ